MKTPQKLLGLIEKKPDGIFVARCPQMGLVASGRTESAAKQALQQVMNAQYAYAKKQGRLGEIFRPAGEFLMQQGVGDGFEVVPGSYAPA